MGILQIYWRATGVSGVHGPLWKNVITGVPSSLLGAYVGMKITEWGTKKMIQNHPKPGKATLKGIGYGVLCGTITLTSALVPILIIKH